MSGSVIVLHMLTSDISVTFKQLFYKLYPNLLNLLEVCLLTSYPNFFEKFTKYNTNTKLFISLNAILHDVDSTL